MRLSKVNKVCLKCVGFVDQGDGESDGPRVFSGENLAAMTC